MSFAPDGTQALLGRREKLVPNGIAALPGGNFLVANVGVEGGIWHLSNTGAFTKLDIRVRGMPLPEVNFVYVDALGRLWASVSSAGMADPVFTPAADEGYILLGDSEGFRIVASGLGWTNELRVHPSGDRLFVNETFGRRLLEFHIGSDGSLQDRTVLAEFGVGDYPDGMALDVQDGIWVVSIISNRIYRIHDGHSKLVFGDSNAQIIDALERLLNSRGLKRADLHGLRTGTVVNNISSLAFGGEDLRTAYLGSLNGSCLWSFRSPVPGIASPVQQPLW